MLSVPGIVSADLTDKATAKPAASYTAPVPRGVEEVDVLVLGQPDIKKLLYTAHHEVSGPRKVRLTFVNPSPSVGKLFWLSFFSIQSLRLRTLTPPGLHFVLLSFALSHGKGSSVSEELWEIFHNATLSHAAHEQLKSHVERLSRLLDEDAANPFNSSISIDEATQSEVKSYLQRLRHVDSGTSQTVSNEASRGQEPFGPFNEREVEDFVRSAGPLSQQAAVDIRRGLSTDSTASGPRHPNSLYQAETELKAPWNSLAGYHLATAYTPLTEASPLRVEDVMGDGNKTVSAAKAQFREWLGALTSSLGETISIRFVTADTFAYCECLRRLSMGRNETWCYARQGTRTPLIISTSSATKFDVIDAAAVTGDRMTTLLALASASPLLKDEPWATFQTEFILKMGEMRENPLEDALYSSTSAVSLLLGISAVEILADVSAMSTVDDVLLGIAEEIPIGNQTCRICYQLSWKKNRHLVKDGSIRRAAMEPTQMADLLLEVDQSMYAVEQREAESGDRRRGVSPAHRISLLASVLEAAVQHITTSVHTVGRILLEKSESNGNGPRASELAELAIQLHLRGLYTAPSLNQEISLKATSTITSFIVAVTVSFNSSAIDALIEDRVTDGGGAIIFEARIHDGIKSHVFHDVHLLSAVENRADNIEGQSIANAIFNLAVTFWAPAWLLAGDDVEVEIVGTPRPQIDSVYGVTVFNGKVFGHYEGEQGVVVEDHMPTMTHELLRLQPLKPVSPDDPLATGSPDEGSRFSLQFTESEGSCLIGRQNLLSDKGMALLSDKVPIKLRQKSPFSIDIVFETKGNESYALQFPYAVTTVGSKTRIARKSGYVEVIAPFATHGDNSPLSELIFPTELASNGIPTPMNMSHVYLDQLPALDVSNPDSIKWITTLTSFQFSSAERVAREQANEKTGMSQSLRVNFKESLFAMFMTSTGLQGGQTGLFVLNQPGTEGVHVIILVSAVRLDCASRSIVLDAAAIPITTELLKDDAMEGFLLILRTLEICRLDVDDEELRLWKKLLPSLAERCRTWNHLDACEYRLPSATVPLSLEPGGQVLCSCGNGKIPEQFVNLPGWEEAASKYAVRIAISPIYACPFVEKTVDFGVLQPADMPRCRNCGKREKDLPKGAKLKKCTRCSKVLYCGSQCQKKDWKKHRHECQETNESGQS